MKSFKLLLVLVFTLALCGCEKESPTLPSAQPAQQFEVRGIVRAIDFVQRELTVEHEEISGYMPAMTMPFSVKELAEVEALQTGDAVGFRLVVTDDDSWITGVKKIAASELRLPAPSTVATNGQVERLKEGDPLPEFALIDDQGRPVSRDTFSGKPLLITFIFTRCPLPNFCPLMSSHFGSIRKAVAGDPSLAEDLRLLSISFDPEFDTPEQLARYAKSYTAEHDQWRFATGAKEEVEKLTGAFAVQVQPQSGTINHGLATALVGRDGVVRRIWRGNGWQPAEVVEELRKL